MKDFTGKLDHSYNGEDAFKKVKTQALNKCCKKYHMIFMDIEMPIMDGYQSSLKIREFFRKPDMATIEPPIIVAVTGYRNEDDERLET